jgi:hypothetical protein
MTTIPPVPIEHPRVIWCPTCNIPFERGDLAELEVFYTHACGDNIHEINEQIQKARQPSE